jgi:hypothetical protein
VNRAYDPRPRRPSRLAFDVSRIVIDVGALLMLGAMSLPFVTAEAFRQRAVAADGLVALMLVAPVFVMTLLPDQSRPLPQPLALASLLLAGAALPYTVVKYLDASTLAGTVQGSVGMGARVLVLGAVIILGGLVLGLIRSRLHPEGEAAEADAFADEMPLAPEPPAARPAATGRRYPGGAASPPGGAGRPLPSEPSPERVFPRWKRPGPARPETPAAPPTPGPERAPVPASRRPPATVAPHPRPAEPDTEPTLPGQRPVQPWWPDDLDDLFS